MKNIAYLLLGSVLLMMIGAAIGWHAKGISVQAAERTAAHAETQAVIAGVTTQAAAQHADQVKEQGKSLALGIDQAAIRATGDRLQQEIDRAKFPIQPPAVVLGATVVHVGCPDDPVGSAEFVRLYDAAAQGAGDPAAAASATAR